MAEVGKGSFVATNPHSLGEKIVASLCHDVRNASQDRDYRSLCIFLAEYLEPHNVTPRVFDIIRSGTCDTSLQVNIIGDLSTGAMCGFLDLVASGGHMRWLRADGETLPTALRDWLDVFKDFVTLFNSSKMEDLLDYNKGDYDPTPRLSCMLCRRGEKRRRTLFLYPKPLN